MVKKKKIQSILSNTIAKELIGSFSKFDFKFKKSKIQFTRQWGEFEQVINLNSVSNPVKLEEGTIDLDFIYMISFSIRIPKYEVWFKEKTGNEAKLNHNFKILQLKAKISYDNFDERDFYEPTTSQFFKKNIRSELEGPKMRSIIEQKDFLNIKLEKILLELNENSDILKIYENREFQFQHMFLLVYGNYDGLASKVIKDCHQYYIDDINDRIKTEANSVNNRIENFNIFLLSVRQISGIVLNNPFKRELKIEEIKNVNIQISDSLIFKEQLRVDISQFEINRLVVNAKGEILLSCYKKLFKLSSQGVILLETDFPQSQYSQEFRPNYHTPIGVFPNNQFYINNFVITAENEILVLVLPNLKQKNQESQIKDIAYWVAQEQYLISYDKYFLIYDKNGIQINSINIQQKFQCKIYPEKEWIVCLNKTVEVLDFSGNKLSDFKSGGVNIEFSSNYEYAISYFLQKKSQLHNFKTGNTDTLFIQNNKIDKVKISPDCKYLVTDCDNTIWSLPELKKTKLQHSILDEKKHVSDIFFMNNGDLFIQIIKVEEFALVWDRNFSFQRLIKLDGKLEYHSSKYLTSRNKSEIIIYKQQ